MTLSIEQLLQSFELCLAVFAPEAREHARMNMPEQKSGATIREQMLFQLPRTKLASRVRLYRMFLGTTSKEPLGGYRAGIPPAAG